MRKKDIDEFIAICRDIKELEKKREYIRSRIINELRNRRVLEGSIGYITISQFITTSLDKKSLEESLKLILGQKKASIIMEKCTIKRVCERVNVSERAEKCQDTAA